MMFLRTSQVSFASARKWGPGGAMPLKKENCDGRGFGLGELATGGNLRTGRTVVSRRDHHLRQNQMQR